MNKFFSLAAGLMFTLAGSAQGLTTCDEAQCTNNNGLPNCCYQAGYDDAVADLGECNTFEYYLNVITLLDSALTVVVDRNDSLELVIAQLEAELSLAQLLSEAYETGMTFYADSLFATLEVLDDTKQELADCGDAVDYNFNLIQDLDAEIDGLEATVDGLETALNTCGDDLAVAEDEVLYWMDAYGDYVEDCNAAIDSITTMWENKVDEATCGFACFETEEELEFFYDGAFYAGVLSVECDDVSDAYDYGYENGLTDGVNSVPACQYNYGDVMEAFYNGYDLGLGDCGGEITGILDLDGQTVTQVVGYYNELGQVIDPRTYEGLVIRRHADGTFSKYYVAR